MYMAWKCRHLLPLAITVDHGLRTGSADEAQAVGRILRQWGLDHQVVKVHVPGNGLALEENARLQRYDAIRDVCLDHDVSTVMVAHTADDQIETFYMRLMRGSSLYGLRGLDAKCHFPISTSRPLLVTRPLLSMSKQSIIKEMTKNKLVWFEDETNHDSKLTHRNFIRSILLENPDLKDSLTKLHRQVVEANAMIDGYATTLAKQVEIEYDWHQGSCIITNIPETDVEVMTRFLFYTLYPLSSARHYPWLYTKLEALVRRGITGTVANLKFVYSGNRLSISQAPKPRFLVNEVTSITEPQLYDNRWWVNTSNPIELMTYNHKHHHHKVRPPLLGSTKLNGVPAEIYHDQIIGFPTFTQKKWKPKHNIYSRINGSTTSSCS